MEILKELYDNLIDVNSLIQIRMRIAIGAENML
jgi:hypothetical protein